jgi:hypothetical protein
MIIYILKKYSALTLNPLVMSIIRKLFEQKKPPSQAASYVNIYKLFLNPAVFQRYGAVKHQLFGGAVLI